MKHCPRVTLSPDLAEIADDADLAEITIMIKDMKNWTRQLEVVKAIMERELKPQRRLELSRPSARLCRRN